MRKSWKFDYFFLFHMIALEAPLVEVSNSIKIHYNIDILAITAPPNIIIGKTGITTP